MPKLYHVVGDILQRKDLTIKDLPWAKAPFISRLAFEKGKQPEHLKDYVPSKGTCAGKTGFVVYKGRRMPRAIVCLAEHMKKKGRRKGGE